MYLNVYQKRQPPTAMHILYNYNVSPNKKGSTPVVKK